jgi:putative transposase
MAESWSFRVQMQKPFYRQKLPHKQAYNAIYFVTYRLYGSIPIPVIQQLQLAYEQSIKELLKSKQFSAVNEYKLQKKHFAQYDSFLDSNLNEPYWLQQINIAQVVYDSLLHLATTDIDLYCFTIMSNHVHALFSLKNNETDLYKIMQSHKSFTAKKGNAILQREGQFWEAESYDHIVRAGEFDNIVHYILQNAVKAGLVKKWEDWKWAYLAR